MLVSMCSDATAGFKAYNNVYLGGDLKDLYYTHFFYVDLYFIHAVEQQYP